MGFSKNILRFQASFDLIKSIKLAEKKAATYVYYVFFVLFVGSLLIYSSIFKNILLFSFSELTIIICVIYIVYLQVTPKIKAIAITAVEVDFFEENIVIKTSPFKILLWANRLATDLIFQKKDLMVTKISYPVKEIFASNIVIRLMDSEKEAYIMTEFFDDRVSKLLLSN